MKSIQSLTNHLLIAMPTLEDPFFNRSVTYICEHSEEGALGIVINMPLEASQQELFEHLDYPVSDNPKLANRLLAGGPVSPERGFVLHHPVGDWQSSLAVSDTVGLSTSEDILKSIAANKGPTKHLISLGYAGWEAGQLEAEIADNSWLFVEASAELIFDTKSDEIWQQATKMLNIDWTQVTHHSGSA